MEYHSTDPDFSVTRLLCIDSQPQDKAPASTDGAVPANSGANLQNGIRPPGTTIGGGTDGDVSGQPTPGVVLGPRKGLPFPTNPCMPVNGVLPPSVGPIVQRIINQNGIFYQAVGPHLPPHLAMQNGTTYNPFARMPPPPVMMRGPPQPLPPGVMPRPMGPPPPPGMGPPGMVPRPPGGVPPGAVIVRPGIVGPPPPPISLSGSESGSDSDSDSDSDSEDLKDEDYDSSSPSTREWLRQKRDEAAENKHLDKVMSLTGLEDVKALFPGVKARFDASKRREAVFENERFDVAFVGSPGTGKTTVAKLYIKLLQSLRVVKRRNFVKGTGICLARAAGFRDDFCSDADRACRKGERLVAFIDDVHEFADERIELWVLLTRLRGLTNKLTVILCGHTEKMHDILVFNTRILNTFPIVKVVDYSEEELLTVMDRIIKRRFKGKMKIDGDNRGRVSSRILVSKVYRDKGSRNFANIVTLETAVNEACQRQARRLQLLRRQGKEPDDFLLIRADITGANASWSPETSPTWKSLQNMVGFEEVKESILALADQVAYNHVRETGGQKPIGVSANRVFVGPPGTGKTTVANLFGRILGEIGFLSKGDVLVRTPADLISEFIGESEKRTKIALDAARGNTLIIDDAHMLDPGQDSKTDKNSDFRKCIVDTLVAEVQNAPGEDRCVILCGYPEQMEELYQNSNQGLARRFPLDTAFRLEDYDSDRLGKILDIRLDADGLCADSEAKKVAMDVLNRAKNRPRFGNGAEVDNLLTRAKLARHNRVRKTGGVHNLDDVPLHPEDFDPDHDRPKHATEHCKQLFKDFVGFSRIVNQFVGYQNMVAGMRLYGVDPRPHIPFTFVFKGPPGTGKTSTARKVGQIFYDMGFLSSPDVVECSASDLVGKYIGHTGPKVVTLVERALGKVLFIDEAYRLAEGEFAKDAVAELVDCVTKLKYSRKLIIILAGYDEDMDKLMKSNQGMQSRFATELVFRPMKPEQCLKHLRNCIGKVGIQVYDASEAGYSPLTQLLTRLSAGSTWASGRSIETLADKVIGHVFKSRVTQVDHLSGLSPLVISVPELVSVLEGTLNETSKKKTQSTASVMRTTLMADHGWA